MTSITVSSAQAGDLLANKIEPSYPLWDGQESVADYAIRTKLPSTWTLDLGDNVRMELVLIPAGKFVMGVPRPEAPKEPITVGRAIFCLSGAASLGFLVVVMWRAVKRRRRVNYSLQIWVLFVFGLSLALYGGVRWYKVHRLWKDYEVKQTRYGETYESEQPAHSVALTRPFYMGKFLVTQEQYQQVTGKSPAHFKGKDNPVESVFWNDAMDFCKSISEKSQYEVRLPTEAEWEYACRAGTTTTYYSGDTVSDLDRIAWYSENSRGTTHPVGLKLPNAFGLFDMSGNVWEWCQDWIDGNYYANSPIDNPRGPINSTDRSLRGGSWGDGSERCRSSHRWWYDPNKHYDDIGFRVVSVVQKTMTEK